MEMPGKEMPGKRDAVVQRAAQIKPVPKPNPWDGDLSTIRPPLQPHTGEAIQAKALLYNSEHHASTPEHRQQFSDYSDAVSAMLVIQDQATVAAMAYDKLAGKLDKGACFSFGELRMKYPELQRAYDGKLAAEGKIDAATKKAQRAYNRLEATWLAQGFRIRPQALETRLFDKVFGAK